ncbi:MAG: acyltransferase [Candidatus Lokiarchaeota archaeon]|nr:acyltransferase [Candidatus Lokiarchaeota archaeon]
MSERFKDWKPPKFTKKNHNRSKSEYGWHVWYLENLKLGKNTDIGFGTKIFAHYGVTIGDNVQMGADCLIYSYDTERNLKGPIIIEENVLIGAKSVVLPRKDGKPLIIQKNKKIPIGSVITDNF